MQLINILEALLLVCSQAIAALATGSKAVILNVANVLVERVKPALAHGGFGISYLEYGLNYWKILNLSAISESQQKRERERNGKVNPNKP